MNYNFSDIEDRRDKIYLFGFSRGAVVARLVAALIGKYGLLQPTQIERFQEILDDEFIGKKHMQDKDIAGFKDNYCYGKNEIKIEFMGLFDTVLGNYQGANAKGLNEIFFDDRILGGHVKTTLHLLAHDETRSLFYPVVFEDKTNDDQILEQIWMPGVHSDVGGNYPDDFLSKVSLMTMLDRVRDYTSLEVNRGRSVELRSSIEDDLGQNRIIVNNELIYPFKWLPKAERWPKDKNECQLSDNKCQLIHPIYKVLEGRSFTTKQKTTDTFKTPEFPFTKYADSKSLNHLHGITI